MKNAEMLYQTVYGSIEELYGASGSVIERILEVKKNLTNAGRIDSQLAAKADSLATAAYQIEDLVEELRSYLNLIQMDEQRLETVEERLDTLNKLKRKYGGSIEAVFSQLETIEQEISKVENISEQIKEVEDQLSKLHAQLKRRSMQLSKKRKKAAEIFALKVAEELDSLNMPQTEFEVILRPVATKEKTSLYLKSDHHTITESGVDRATFMIAPNPGRN